MQTSHLLHTLLLLLLAAAVSLRSNAEDVLDTAGNTVRPGLKYYMVSSIRGAGGGGVLPVKYPGGSSCASYVGWAALDVDRGVPVIISSVNSSHPMSIEEQERVHIRFSKVGSCAKTPYWTLAAADGLVATGGARPVDAFDVGPFLFQKDSSGLSNAYKLTLCPCARCSLVCLDVVRSSVKGQRILGTGFQNEFTVFLIKAEGSVSSSHSFPSSLLRTPADFDD